MMEEARGFSIQHLTDMIKGDCESLEPCLVEKIKYALKLPLNWRVNRVHCRWYIEMYEREHENMIPVLLELAKLDFSMVQSVHQRELRELSRWWTDLDICKMHFSRDRLVENYLAAVFWASEPKSWRCREALTKFNVLITLVDDVYDIYGSIDELELFTNAVEKWELREIEKLPEYMKICFLALFNTANDIAYKTLKDKNVDVISFFKSMWASQCKAYLIEAKWYQRGYTPTLEEYLENARITIAIHLVLTVANCVNEHVTLESLERFKSLLPDIVHSPSTIMRVCNDMTTSSHELERGDVSKSVECYMYENGIPETLAREHMWDLIRRNWKRLNRGHGFASSTTEKLLYRVALNCARTAHFVYQHEDGYGKNHDDETKDCIISLFIEPMNLL